MWQIGLEQDTFLSHQWTQSSLKIPYMIEGGNSLQSKFSHHARGYDVDKTPTINYNPTILIIDLSKNLKN